MVLLFQCKYRCVKLNMLKLAPKTEQDSNGTFHQGAFLLPRWPPGHLKAHICFDRCGFFCSLLSIKKSFRIGGSQIEENENPSNSAASGAGYPVQAQAFAAQSGFYFSLEQYAKEHPMPRFSDCVVCFTQVYDQCLPTRRIRDYDNLEEKQLLDVLSTFVMADDTGLLCDAYNTAALGEKDCTRISVMEKKRFPAWLAEHENTLKSISDF